MLIKSPYSGIKPKQKPQNVFDLTSLLTTMDELKSQIESVKQLKEQFVREHQTKLEELTQVFEQIKDIASRIQKGDPGQDAKPVDEEALVQKIQSKIRVPKDGEPGLDAVVNEKKIAKLASELIKIPTPKPLIVDHAEVADKVIELLQSGKKKLSIKHLGDFTDGLEQTLRPIRSLVAGFRGGGDVVTAGVGVSITVNADGKKIITNTGTAITLIDNEVVSGNTNTFTLANTPIAGTVKVYALGQRLVLTTDYSIVGAIITTVSSWNTGQIVADYQK